MKARTVDPSAVRVARNLSGAPLASPMRRLLAYAADWAVITPISFGILLLLLTASLGRTDPEALAGLKTLAFTSNDSLAVRREALGKILPLLVRKEAAELPRRVTEAVERGDIVTAVAELDKNSILLAYNIGHEPYTVNKGPEEKVKVQLQKLLPSYMQPLALFAAGALFFALPWTFGRGATIGNLIFRIRVVRLDGHRLGLLESFERFLGYLHIPATAGLALLGLWNDPLRRMPHDRVANTVVIRKAGRVKNDVSRSAASGTAVRTGAKAVHS
jgi:uncharacterized RDD family membrane protein YckC